MPVQVLSNVIFTDYAHAERWLSQPQLYRMASRSAIVKVAAVQAAPVSFDLDKSLDKLEKLTAEAAGSGADLVVFP